MGVFGSKPPEMPGADVLCPHCGSREYLDVRPAYMATIRAGKVVQVECGRCVACLQCDGPYVIVPHRPGGVMTRRRVAAGQEIPSPRKPSGEGQRALDGLAAALGGANMPVDEPL